MSHQFDSLFDDLEGAAIVVPSVEGLSPKWPLRKNPKIEEIREDYVEWVNS